MTKDFKIGLMVGSVLLVIAMIWISIQKQAEPQTKLSSDQTVNMSGTNKVKTESHTPRVPPPSSQQKENTSKTTVPTTDRKRIETNSFFPDPVATAPIPVEPNKTKTIEPKPEPKEVIVQEIIPVEPPKKEEPPKVQVHEVVSGDSISTIAKKYYGRSTPTEWKKISEANPQLKDPQKLRIGMRLVIPD